MPAKSHLIRVLVHQDATGALAIARQLAREGHDTTELEEVAIAALAARRPPADVDAALAAERVVDHE